MFGILLTVGFGYFYSITQGQQYYQLTLKQQNLATSQKNAESLIMTSAIVSNQIQVTIYNVGISANITSLFVNDNSTGTSQYVSLSGGRLVPQGGSTNIGGITYVPGNNYLIKALTARGNVFETTYPPLSASLATQALTSGSLGDIYMAFNTYSYYNVTSGSPCPASGGTYSGYCLSKGLPAFTIPSSISSNPIAFSVTMTDLNTAGASIVLDQFSLMYENLVSAPNGKNPFIPWYVITNSSTSSHNAILNTYAPLILKYDVPTTVVFASLSCMPTTTGDGPNDCGSNPFTINAPGQSPGTVTPVFMMMHGWEVANNTSINLGTLTFASENYGQNMPYVSTLYS